MKQLSNKLITKQLLLSIRDCLMNSCEYDSDVIEVKQQHDELRVELCDACKMQGFKKLGIGVVRDCTANKILCIEHVLENTIHLSKDTAVILGNTLKCIDKLYSVQVKGDILDTAATVAAADALGLKHEHIEETTIYDYDRDFTVSGLGVYLPNWANEIIVTSDFVCGTRYSEHLENPIMSQQYNRFFVYYLKELVREFTTSPKCGSSSATVDWLKEPTESYLGMECVVHGLFNCDILITCDERSVTIIVHGRTFEESSDAGEKLATLISGE